MGIVTFLSLYLKLFFDVNNLAVLVLSWIALSGITCELYQFHQDFCSRNHNYGFQDNLQKVVEEI